MPMDKEMGGEVKGTDNPREQHEVRNKSDVSAMMIMSGFGCGGLDGVDVEVQPGMIVESGSRPGGLDGVEVEGLGG